MNAIDPEHKSNVQGFPTIIGCRQGKKIADFNGPRTSQDMIKFANDNNKTGILDIRINGIKNDLYNYDIYINSKTQKMAILTIAHKLLEFGIDENYFERCC